MLRNAIGAGTPPHERKLAGWQDAANHRRVALHACCRESYADTLEHPEAFVKRWAIIAITALSGAAVPAAAQTPAGLTGDLITVTTQLEQKVLALAGAMSEAQYAWRPGEGVRSVGEVLMHIAADNYLLPTGFGISAPAATGITATDFPALQKYEKQKLSKAATIAEVEKSFVHLKRAFAQIPEARMNENVKFFGQDFTVRSLLILTTTHLHEHLGQMIAYARSNGVVPPWSR
jgi:uncharacterized damage-inducible protein DinB